MFAGIRPPTEAGHGACSATPIRCHDPSQGVEDLAKVVIALGCVLSDERQIRGDERPLLVGNIARVWFSSSHAEMLSRASQIHHTLKS